MKPKNRAQNTKVRTGVKIAVRTASPTRNISAQVDAWLRILRNVATTTTSEEQQVAA
jgi:hypothetical protein